MGWESRARIPPHTPFSHSFRLRAMGCTSDALCALIHPSPPVPTFPSFPHTLPLHTFRLRAMSCTSDALCVVIHPSPPVPTFPYFPHTLPLHTFQAESHELHEIDALCVLDVYVHESTLLPHTI